MVSVHKVTLSEEQLGMINAVIAKFTVLVVVAMISSLIFFPMLAVWDLHNGIVYLIDAVINVTCLTLQFRFAQAYYDRICYCCHKGCQTICVGIVEARVSHGLLSFLYP